MQRTLVCLLTLGTLAASSAARADNQAVASAPASEAQPSAPEPTAPPPAPAPRTPPPPSAQPIETPPPPAATVVRGAPPAAAGQWVYTQQYGWLWMPYDQGYTYVVDNAALAYEYVFYPSFGWRWVVAPWVLGFGLAPHWGALGPGHFAWYARPWFRVGTAHLRPSWGRAVAPRSFSHGGHFAGHGHR